MAALLALCVTARAQDEEEHIARKPGNKQRSKPATLDFERPGAVADARKALLEAQINARLKGREVLSLDAALSEALEKSTALKTAQLDLHNMIENVDRARYRYYPDFTIEAAPSLEERRADDEKNEYSSEEVEVSATLRQHVPGNIDIAAGADYEYNDRTRDIQRYSLSISKEILRPDSVKRDLALARLKLDLEDVARGQTRRHFIYEVKSAYYDYLKRWLLCLNSVAKFNDDRDLNKESEGKYAAGIIAQYQLLDYQRDFTDSEMSLADDRLRWMTARNRLLFLMQRPLESPIEFRPYDREHIAPARGWDAKAMLESALKTSVAVAGLKTALMTSEENRDYYRKRLLPSLSLYGDIEHEKDESSGRNVVPQETLSSVGLRLMFPLFQSRFTERSRIRTEQNAIEISELELDEWFRSYQRAIADDLLELQNMRKHYELANRKFRISYVDYELGKLRFANGTIGSWDRIRNKNQFFSANARSISLQYQLLQLEARLERDYPVSAVTGLDGHE